MMTTDVEQCLGGGVQAGTPAREKMLAAVCRDSCGRDLVVLDCTLSMQAFGLGGRRRHNATQMRSIGRRHSLTGGRTERHP